MKETDRQMKETDRQMKSMGLQFGKLNNRFGELAEHLVAPGIMEKFNALGSHFDSLAPNLRISENGRVVAEIDIFMENSAFSVAIEVKTRPLVGDVKEHIERLAVLRRHKDRVHDIRKIHGAVAGAIMSESVRRHAQKAGFYVIEQSGDTVKIDIPEGFIPREW
jgi:predicted RecB family endonuclease